jgi:hypothetical protein
MSDHSTPTDGNPPAPIRRTVHPPIGKGFVLEHPENPLIFPRMRLTMAVTVTHSELTKEGLRAFNEERRAVHTGPMSHDERGAA